MAYDDHFKLTDDMINHLDTVISGISDPFISSRYIGFVSVSAVTVYELAVKEIFCTFANRKHKVLGDFALSYFDRINGRVKLKIIRNEYISRFGTKYVDKFKRKIDRAEQKFLRTSHVSIKNSYNNVIEWRNQFAHEGQIPSTVTYSEVIKSYKAGKEVIHCLPETMRR
ncbi:MAG: HEPN domain-containing protein [Leptolyngbyaceae cyanobacterium]